MNPIRHLHFVGGVFFAFQYEQIDVSTKQAQPPCPQAVQKQYSELK